MKKTLSLVLSLVMMMSIFAVSFNSFAAEPVSDSDVRSMFTMVNDFRTGSDAWYWNEGNATKTVLKDLAPYTYDTNLEKIAKIRAEEIVQKYDHERPDGTLCFTCTVKDADGNVVETYAENIARGNNLTAAEAFEFWCEKDELYEGQGHRRNMLDSKYNSIGIAGYKADDGNVYWVQEISKIKSASSTPSAPSPKKTTTASKKSNTLTVKAKKATVKFAKLKKKNQTVALKKAMTVSNAQGAVTYKLSSAKKGKKNFKKYFKVAKNGKITVKKGLKKGTYKISIKVSAAGNASYNAASKTVTVTIKVK